MASTACRYCRFLNARPALAEADDGAEYVVKFRGAGHGEKALVAEVLVGEIGRLLGDDLPAPGRKPATTG